MSFITRVFASAKKFALAHKIWSAAIVIVLLGGGWYAYGKMTSTTGETRYVLGTVATGTVVANVSASGQVSTSDKVDLSAKASGEVVWVGVKEGDTVRAGQALASLDATDAKQSLEQAEAAYAEDQLQFQQAQAQAPIDYQNAQQAVTDAQSDLTSTYNDTFNTLSTTYLDLPNIMTGLQNTLDGYDLSPSKSQWNIDVMTNLFNNLPAGTAYTTIQSFSTSASGDYATARSKYDASVVDYKAISRYSSGSALESQLSEAVDTTTAVAQSLQSTLNLLGEVVELGKEYNVPVPSQVSTMQTSVRGYLSTVNGDLSSLLAQQKSIDSGKKAITTAQQNLTLLNVGNNSSGSNPISLQVSQNNLTKEAQNIENLKEALADYTVVAPFGGTVSAVNATVGTNASGALVSLITDQEIATLSLNEVDAAKVKAGDKATLTFDAIDGLTLTGTVASVDTVGTVSQGVVSYDITLTFDTQDSRVKPGMTVNASIITDAHQDVLTVPSSAVKTVNGSSFVQIFTPPLANTGGTQGVVSETPPTMAPVTVGLTGDTTVEITSGLSAGEQIVVSTRTSNTTSASATARTSTTGTAGTATFRASGNAGFGGGGTVLRGL
ncbi:MAG TPA: HlyD family efflux transporter periplasmic adaptor subunit [Candidatus Paceibacterota bacterium]|nr:HlyD family efflux transporter periplasmic adaptor subunit [Candidatus Paceibacterota bacterium]